MILESEIRGTKHYEGAAYALRNYVHRGDSLTLERDPSNKFSCVAIKVLWASTFLGFVRDSDAQRIAPVIDSGHTVSAAYKGNNNIDVYLPFDV